MPSTKTEIILTARDRTRSAFQKVSKSVSGLERTVGRVTKAFAVFVGAGAIGGLVKSANDASLAMDRFNRTFRAATGSAVAGAKEMQFVTELTQELGINLEESAGAYAKLTAAARGTVLAGKETRNIFEAIAGASVVLGLTAEQTGGALTAIEQIISKGKVSAEELRGQLGERLPGAFQAAARAIGVTTAKLDEMLRNGELLAEDLLPLLAEELKRTYGPELENAIDSTQSSIQRFNNAIFRLKAELADGALSNSLAAIAESFAATFAPTIQQQIDQANERFGELQKRIELLQSSTASELPFITGQLRPLQEELKLTGALLEELFNAQDELFAGPTEFRNDAGFAAALDLVAASNEMLDKIFSDDLKKYERELESFIRSNETAEQKVARLQERLSRFASNLPDDEVRRISDNINAILSEGIEEIDINSIRKLKRFTKKAVTEMDEFTKQAARNMQDAFADFLFDPFDEGLKGMLKGFLDVIRRMLAEQAAAGIFGAIGGATGPLSGIGKLLGFQHGGQFVVGGAGGADSQLVQFMATPGEKVSIDTPGQSRAGKGVSLTFHIDARGADEARIMRVLPAAVEQASSQAVARIQQMRNEGDL